MNIQRKIISVILIIILAGTAIYFSNKEIKSFDDQEEIEAWYSRTDTMYFWYSDPELSDYINKAAVDFGEQYDVHVFPMLITVDNYIETINQASIYNDQMPDAYLIDNASLEMAYQAGLAAEIDDIVSVCNTDNFSQAALNAVTYDGKIVGYPLSYNTCALLYNKNYLDIWVQEKALAILNEEADDYVITNYLGNVDIELEEANEEDWYQEAFEENIDYYEMDSELVPYKELSDDEKQLALDTKVSEIAETALPQTLNELLAIANSFNAPEGVEGVMFWDVSDIFYNYWIVGDVVDLGGVAGDDENLISINNTEALNCLKYYQYLNEFFYIEAENVDYEDVINDFIDGKMLFTIASSDVIEKLEEAKNAGTLGFEYGFTSIPDIDENTLSRNMSTTTAVVVNGYSEKKVLANAFATYLTYGFSDELYARTGKPAAKIGANDKYADLEVFDEEYAKSIPLPKIIELENIWMELEAMFASIWDGDDVEIKIQELENTVNLFFS